ncbi:hypothetical protein T230_11570 [Tannerella sp. oral taxon BU063 isolate Cell 1/3]|uniref:Epoxyqueuosine reductase QueH n=1 Tax=Tannerella sp. oral taxon BU063 isolate Cell 1/3 TaxID=1411022 RepID=W2CHI0_9BACT|nr:hypothetical protein T230_11570 [Tannerella sp. oral taxon BU063 isolate Cell 1/3]
MKQKKSPFIVPDGADRVLLHACCAPCSSAILEWMLAHGLHPTLIFCNPNIFPLEEYTKRKAELQRHALRLGVPFTDADYDHAAWRQRVRGLEHEPERGARCQMCFAVRLETVARYAHEHDFPVFTTTLASSRWKSLEQITAAGEAAAARCPGLTFWAQNWRKGGLSDRRNALIKEYNFYNQNYCGCEFSIRPESQNPSSNEQSERTESQLNA